MLFKAFLPLLSSVSAAWASPADLEPRAVEGAAACVPSKTQPFSFKGIMLVKSSAGYYYDNRNVPVYLSSEPQYDDNDYLIYRKSISKAFKGYNYDGAIATPCDTFRSKVVFNGKFGYNGVNAYEVGIMRRTTNQSQCLNMVAYNRACQLDICEPDTPYPTGYSDAPLILGSAWDVRWLPCPKTNAEILANDGQFLFAWAYNSTGQPKTPSLVSVHPRVLVHRANEITNPQLSFGRNGYSLGDRGDGHAVLVGTAYKSNYDPIQLVNAFNGNRTRTLAEVTAQTKKDPYNSYY